eukprot:7196-Heterococcus_DN1.PRE.2
MIACVIVQCHVPTCASVSDWPAAAAMRALNAGSGSLSSVTPPDCSSQLIVCLIAVTAITTA